MDWYSRVTIPAPALQATRITIQAGAAWAVEPKLSAAIAIKAAFITNQSLPPRGSHDHPNRKDATSVPGSHSCPQCHIHDGSYPKAPPSAVVKSVFRNDIPDYVGDNKGKGHVVSDY